MRRCQRSNVSGRQEHRPTRPREQTAQRREQCTIVRLQARPWMLAAQHRKLVA
jgi:hypothetical protein